MTTKLSILCLAIGTALSLNVQASEENEHDDIEHIEVFGHKIVMQSKDVASSISTLNAEQVQRSQEAELSQILRELPGVELNGGITPLTSQPSIRGLYGERIHVSVDDVKRKTESDGTSNVAAINSLGIDPSQLKQVQVLRGADSLTVGSGAIGGSLRLATKDAADYLSGQNGMGGRIQLLHQSAVDSNSLSGSVFSLTDTLDTVVHASHVAYSDVDVVGGDKAEDTPAVAQLNTIKNDSSRDNLSIKNTWFINPQHTIRSKIDWSRTESLDQPYALRQDLGQRYPTLSEDYKNDYLEVSGKYIYQPNNPLIDFDLQLVYSDKDYEEETKGFIVSRGNQIDFSKVAEGKTRRHNVRLANLSEFTGVIDHRLAFELNYERETFEQSEFEDNTNSSFYGDSESDNWSISVIDQAEFFDDRLLTTIGARYDAYERSNNLFSDYAHNDDGELSNEVGLTFKVTDYLNLYTKYAEAFRAPSVQELYKRDEWRCHIGGKICYQEPQPDLKPESSDNIELGAGLFFESLSYADTLGLKVMYFDNKIKNFIANVPFMYYIDDNGDKQQGSPGPQPANGVPVATHRDYSAKNIGKLDSRGWEAELSYSYQNWDAFIGYSSIRMDAFGVPNFFLGTVEQTTQVYTEAPADKLSVNVNYQWLPTLNIGAQLLAYAKQDRLPERYVELGYDTEAYEVFNVNARYQGEGVLEGLTIALGVDNVTDERYFRAPASEARDPSEVGRSYKVTVSYQF